MLSTRKSHPNFNYMSNRRRLAVYTDDFTEPRALTNRERARLQTFPDDFIFEGSKESVRRQIGMAVPCAGAKIIFEAVLKTFADIDYDSVPCNISFENELDLFAEII